MHLTTRTNLAMRTLMFCAVNADVRVRKQQVAEACNASPNHLAQVIHLLGRAGYLTTQRGRTGGFQLARPPAEINVGSVFRTFEGVLPFTECAEPGCACPLVGACRLKCVLADAIEGFYRSLDRVTLQDLVKDNRALAGLLAA